MTGLGIEYSPCIKCDKTKCSFCELTRYKKSQCELQILTDADVVEVVRCKDCKYHHGEQEAEHGKTEYFCSVLKAQVFKDFYCYHGAPKERGGEK